MGKDAGGKLLPGTFEMLILKSLQPSVPPCSRLGHRGTHRAIVGRHL